MEQRLKALQKSVAQGDPASSITAILKTLLDEVVPTEELLRVRPLIAMRIPRARMWISHFFCGL